MTLTVVLMALAETLIMSELEFRDLKKRIRQKMPDHLEWRR